MMRLMHFRYSRLVFFVLIPQIIFIIVAYLTEDMFLRRVINIIEQAISAGICAAYFPGTARWLAGDGEIDSSDILGLGVVLTWTGSFFSTVFSLLWVAYGEPMSWVHSDIPNYIKFVYVCGGLCHLLAPGALRDRLPTKRWLQLGSAVALGMALSLAIAWAADVKVKSVRSLIQNDSGLNEIFRDGEGHDAVAGPPPSNYQPQRS